MLDAGCGSAIHSLAALRLGAATICAFDRDPVATATARSLVAQYAPCACIRIVEASLLDKPFSDQQFDIVLCWGAAHHTGALWPTLAYLSQRLSRGGILILAVYKKTPFCRFWRWEKRLFCRLPRLGRSLVATLYLSLLLSAVAMTGRNPIAYIRSYRCRRGMSLWHDAIDWLGGIPYESAKPEDVIRFMNNRDLDLLSLHHGKPMIGLAGSGCAEFVFRANPDISKLAENPVQ